MIIVHVRPNHIMVFTDQRILIRNGHHQMQVQIVDYQSRTIKV
jgi:hypothetical protein